MIAINFLSIIFWGVLASYIVHIIDETLMANGFTAKVREHWWPEYNIKMFFWFNTFFLLGIVLSILLFELLGGHWIILPLFWTFERATHTITLHLWWSIRYKEYSPGLLSGILFLVLGYWVIKYGYLADKITHYDFIIGLISGMMGGIILSFLPTVIMPFFASRKQSK